VYHPEGVDVAGARVNATALAGLDVTVRVVGAGRILAETNATTDGEGDWSVDVPAGDLPEDARVVAEARGRVATANASAELRRADVPMLLAGVGDAGSQRPGAGVGRVPFPSALALLAALALTSAARGRRRR
jgi:hypothetical protein